MPSLAECLQRLNASKVSAGNRLPVESLDRMARLEDRRYKQNLNARLPEAEARREAGQYAVAQIHTPIQENLKTIAAERARLSAPVETPEPAAVAERTAADVEAPAREPSEQPTTESVAQVEQDLQEVSPITEETGTTEVLEDEPSVEGVVKPKKGIIREPLADRLNKDLRGKGALNNESLKLTEQEAVEIDAFSTKAADRVARQLGVTQTDGSPDRNSELWIAAKDEAEIRARGGVRNRGKDFFYGNRKEGAFSSNAIVNTVISEIARTREYDQFARGKSLDATLDDEMDDDTATRLIDIIHSDEVDLGQLSVKERNELNRVKGAEIAREAVLRAGAKDEAFLSTLTPLERKLAEMIVATPEQRSVMIDEALDLAAEQGDEQEVMADAQESLLQRFEEYGQTNYSPTGDTLSTAQSGAGTQEVQTQEETQVNAAPIPETAGAQAQADQAEVALFRDEENAGEPVFVQSEVPETKPDGEPTPFTPERGPIDTPEVQSLDEFIRQENETLADKLARGNDPRVRFQMVVEATKILPDQQRDIMQRALQGETNQQIASHLQIPEAEVEIQKERAAQGMARAIRVKNAEAGFINVQVIWDAVDNFRKEFLPGRLKAGEQYRFGDYVRGIWAGTLEKGQLPKDMRIPYDLVQGRIQGVRSRFEQLTYAVKRAVEKLHPKDKKARQAEYDRIQQALTGEEVDGITAEIDFLDESLKPSVWALRRGIDTLSKLAVERGVVTGATADTFSANIGNYMRRGYMVFDKASGWNYKYVQKYRPELIVNATRYLISENPQWKDLHDADPQNVPSPPDQASALIQELLDRDSASSFMLTGQTSLGKQVGSLMRRKDIAEPIRALMGEIKDPLVNAVRSGDFLGQLIARHEQQTELRSVGFQLGIFSDKKDGRHPVPLVGEGTKKLDALKGIYTTAEFRDAFNMAEQDGIVMGTKGIGEALRSTFLTGGSLAKAAVTIGNPASYMTNYIGAVVVEAANGRWMPSTWGDSIRMATFGGQNKVPRELKMKVQKDGLRNSFALFNELKRQRVLDQNIEFQDFKTSVEGSFAKHLPDWVKKLSPMNQLGSVYSFGDNIGKTNAYIDEFKTLREAYPDWSFDQVSDEAARIAVDTTPTYRTVPKVIQESSRIGFVFQSFINFTYSIARATAYTAAQAKSELQSGNPVLVKRGARRLTGLSLMLAASSYWGPAMLSRMWSGTEDDEDEALRRSFMPEWDRHANLVYGFDGVKDGKVTYSNQSYLFPQAQMTELVTAVLDGEGPAQRTQFFFDSLMSNISDESLLLAKLLDVSRNSIDSTGRRVYNPETDFFPRQWEKLKYVGKAFVPGAISMLDRSYKGITGQTGEYGKTYDVADEMARVAGVRASTLDINKALGFRLRDLNRRFLDAEMIQKDAERKTLAPEEQAQAKADSERAKTRIINQYKTLLKDARKLGITEKTISESMKETKVQSEVRNLIR